MIGAFALVLSACDPAPTGSTVGPIDFEDPPYVLGDIDGQDGWSSTGPYDHVVDDVAASGSEPDDFGFGEQSLRISNAVGGGSFDHTYSKPTTDHAGEVTNGAVTGTRHGFFEASWSFATAGNPLAEQVGLSVVASPDRGDGARMSWVQMADTAAGFDVNFYEYDSDHPDADAGGFVFSPVATGLSRLEAHSVRVRMFFYDGVDNDVVEVCVNGTTCVVGNSWEDYFREQEANPTRPVDSVLFRTSVAAAGTAGNGLFIDGFEAKSVTHTGANVAVSGPTNLTEGNAGESVATYTITLDEPLPVTVHVPYNTVDGTAVAPGDYTATSGTVTFAPGETVKTVDVAIQGDTADEVHEDFTFHLDPPTTEGRAAGDASGTYVFRHVINKKTNIRDDDSTVNISDASVDEPTSGSAQAAFGVTLDNPSAVPVTVQFTTANGSAVAPGDYTARNFTLTFNPGQTAKTVTVSVKADNLVEGDENFLGTIHSPTNATIADGIGAAIIDDADD